MVRYFCSCRTGRGRLTFSATLRASRPSRTARSSISDSTRWILRTVAGELVRASTVTQDWTSAWLTWCSLTFCQRGRTWWRTMPSYRLSVEGLRWA